MTSAATADSVQDNMAADASTSLSFAKAAPAIPLRCICHGWCWLRQLRAPQNPTRTHSPHWRAAGDSASFTVVSCRVPDATLG